MSWVSALGDRFHGAIAGPVGRLPPAVLRMLAGGKPVRVDGQKLEAEIQLVLTMQRLYGRPRLDTMTPAEARHETERNARIFGGTPIPVARVDALAIPGPAGPIPARLYLPHRRRGYAGRVQSDAALPLVVYFHGGGWVVGGLDSHDSTCRFVADRAGVAVLAIDYRLAPEHRFPAAVDDAFAAFAWAAREAAALGCDPARVVVGGDSAGGNLATVVSRLAADANGPRPALQLLVYPVTDLSTKHRSYRLFSDGFLLTEAVMDWYRGHYLPDEQAAFDPRASPLLGDVRGLPTAIVLTAGCDVLRDEGEAYARRMQDEGVRVELRRSAGQIHGFANATGVSPSARTALAEAARLLTEMLA